MQTFTCPNCGHESTYDPWGESAHCDGCGYEPALGRRAAHRRPKRETATYQPLLDELLTHWNNTHTPDLAFTLQTADQALTFFKDYQRMLGESPDALAGYVEFVRNCQPNRGEILAFVGAYLLLKQGKRAEAARHLRALTMQSKFPDPWIWLTATTDAPAERREYLEADCRRCAQLRRYSAYGSIRLRRGSQCRAPRVHVLCPSGHASPRRGCAGDEGPRV
jgi:hypothetical protein